MLEAQVLCERWRRNYNEVRPHSALRLPAASTASDRAMAGLHRAIPGDYGDGHTNIACGSV